MADSGALGAGVGAAAVACKTTPTPGGPCTFQAEQGQLTLRVIGVVGVVGFETATYKGTPIPGTPSRSITFAVTPGPGDLIVVYAFSDTAAGSGELHEACKDDVLLDPNVNFTNPAVAYSICA